MGTRSFAYPFNDFQFAIRHVGGDRTSTVLPSTLPSPRPGGFSTSEGEGLKTWLRLVQTAAYLLHFRQSGQRIAYGFGEVVGRCLVTGFHDAVGDLLRRMWLGPLAQHFDNHLLERSRTPRPSASPTAGFTTLDAASATRPRRSSSSASGRRRTGKNRRAHGVHCTLESLQSTIDVRTLHKQCISVGSHFIEHASAFVSTCLADLATVLG